MTTNLLPAMLALRQWGEKWELGTPSNPVLCDDRDGRPIARIAIHEIGEHTSELQSPC